MEPVNYYTSIVLDPQREDNEKTQEDVIIDGYSQYRIDSILNTIGTDECAKNIDLFYREILANNSEESILNFFGDCFKRLIEVYNLDTLEDFSLDEYFIDNDRSKDLTKLLYFFEKDGWISVIQSLLPQISKEVINDKKRLKSFLELHYNVMIKNIFNRNDILNIIKFFIQTTSKENLINLLTNLIFNNRNKYLTEMILV